MVKSSFLTSHINGLIEKNFLDGTDLSTKQPTTFNAEELRIASPEILVFKNTFSSVFHLQTRPLKNAAGASRI
jgi:hypothetical protein